VKEPVSKGGGIDVTLTARGKGRVRSHAGSGRYRGVSEWRGGACRRKGEGQQRGEGRGKRREAALKGAWGR